MRQSGSFSPRVKRGILFQHVRKTRLRSFQPRPPRYWRRLTPLGGLISSFQHRDWLLVLSSRNVPYRLAKLRGFEHIFVPPFYEKLALKELESFAAENLPRKSSFKPWPLHKHWIWAPLYLLPLIGLYSLENCYPDAHVFGIQARGLQNLGSLDAIRVFLHGEWYRAITALFFHVNITHLVGNLFFGSIFLIALARLCGIGYAWLLTILGGVAGNLASLYIHKLGYVSIGFSTALFASVGAIGGLLLFRSSEKILMPLAAGAGLLAMLGTEGERTDYAAHICGFLAGALLGLGLGYEIRRNWRLLPQFLAAAIAFVIPAAAFICALIAN